MSAVDTLVAASREACLVVGPQDRSALEHVLVGSTAGAVAPQSHCLVVVVHGADVSGDATEGVVVGVDPGGRSGIALEVGAVEASWPGPAAHRPAGLAVGLGSPPYVGCVPSDDPSGPSPVNAEPTLAEAVAGLQERSSEV